MKYFFICVFLIVLNFVHGSPMADFISKEARILEKKYHLSRFGTGFFGPYKGYKFSYNFYGEMTIEEARRLIVSFASDLQNRTHLFNFAKDFEGEKDGKQSLWINVHFLDKRHNYISNGNHLCFVSFVYGNLKYHICGEDERFIPIYEESFEEAAEILSKNFSQNCNN